MASDEKWYFTKEQLLQSPSRKSGYDVDKELSCRQQAANFIQDMGQRLQVSQLCINTAIVYMHRFYVFHSLASFHRNAIAAAALFLAAKVEEQPRKLEHVIKVAHICLHRENPNLDTKSEVYLEQAQDLVFNENVLLQTLGFDVAIDHPHTHVVRCCHLVRGFVKILLVRMFPVLRVVFLEPNVTEFKNEIMGQVASKDLAQTSYFMASNSLHLTTMCLQYKPTVVACFCIHLACKWSNWEIPRSNEGKDWFWYVDKSVTLELLEQLTGEFLAIFDKCPTKLKRKMMSMNQNNTSAFPQQSIPHDGLQFVSNFEEPRKLSGAEAVKPPEGLFPVQKQNSQLSSDKPSTSSSSAALSSHTHHQKIDYREYREKKERERLEREKQQHHHHSQQQRDGHGNVSSNSHHHSKGGPLPIKGPSGSQSRSSTSISHKSYQQQPHGQQNLHFQNAKESVDGSSGPNFQPSRDKDNSYLKHPHSERDNSKDHHGQFSQSGNVQHQNYPHKSDSSYTHREGARTNHSGSSNLSQSHHSQSHSSSNQTSLANPREFGAREGTSAKDNNEVQSQPPKKDMSSSIRDIIGQSLPQIDSHSMTNERKDIRDKNRSNYMYGNMPSSNRAEALKNGQEQSSKIFHEPNDKKVEDFASRTKERVFKKEEEEPVIDAVKVESITPIKGEKFDESDSAENYVGAGGSGSVNNWKYDFGLNLSNVKNEKKDLSGISKTDATAAKTEMAVDKMESGKSDIFAASAEVNSSKSQAVHPARGAYDSKYKGHHYPCGNKSSDISQFKNEKPSAQYSSDVTKKFNDRLHEKLRKGEMDRVSHMPDVGSASELTKHHKLNKDVHEKQKVLMPGQQHVEQKLKDRSSPSKYPKMKTMSRPCNLDYLKPESGHFSLGSAIENSSAESEKNEKIMPGSHKVTVSEDNCKGMNNVNNFHKQQKSHEFGSSGGLSSSLPDSNLIKGAKTSSIFSPDSKIPPQNILSSLEKDSKKNISVSHRTVSSKSSPTSVAANVKGVVPTSASINAAVTSSGATGSLFSPPLPKSQASVARHRTSSSGSEPELIPVLTKIEETPGYENIIREKRVAISSSEKPPEKSVITERSETSSLFDFDLKGVAKEKSGDIKTSIGRTDASHFGATKQPSSVKLSSEIRSDLGAVIYPNNPKPVSVSKPGSTFSLTEPKLSLANSISTVNLSGIEKMVDTSISPAKQSNPYGAPSSLKSNLGMNINFTLPVSSASNILCSAASGQSAESADKLSTDQNSCKSNPTVVNQELIDVEDVGHSDSKKKSDKKKKKDKHKHKDKDRSERKKEKKKHKEKDKERVKEKEKHKDKERSKEKEKHKEKEIDVVNSEIVNSEAPIKITIPKDKISGGLKIKISKDCLKKEEVDSPKSGTSGELKLKISKDKFSHMSTYKEETKSSSKKRERSPKSYSDLPYPKLLKTSDKKISSSSRSNGTDGSSRNISSHRHSVSENGSHIDISSLYDFPFDFEENGEGIIKTPDYDFESLNTSDYPQSVNTLSEESDSFVKNSQNECEKSDSQLPPSTEESYPRDIDHSDADISSVGPALSAFPAPDSCTKTEYPKPEEDVPIPKLSPAVEDSSSPLKISRPDVKKSDPLPTSVSVPERVSDDCYILKNYKSILDSHSKGNTVQSGKTNVEGRSNEEVRVAEECSSTVVEPVAKSTRKSHDLDSENPNYYNKYFKKEGSNRTWLSEKNKSLKPRVEDKQRSDDKSRFHDKFEPPSQRYRNDYPERSRHYREYCADPQYYFDGGESRRFDYQKYVPNHFFNLNKTDNEVVALNYDVNANESARVYQHTKNPSFVSDSGISNNALDVSMQYHPYGYYNSYMYNNGGYRFYGNVPFVNMSLINQQPTPPGTVDTSVQLGPPPLPLEPPPDLPPPPETPPPKQT